MPFMHIVWAIDLFMHANTDMHMHVHMHVHMHGIQHHHWMYLTCTGFNIITGCIYMHPIYMVCMCVCVCVCVCVTM